MTDAIAHKNSSQLSKFDPVLTHRKLSALEAGIEHAKRMLDWDSLEKAVDLEIGEMCSFVDWWHQAVTPNHGAGRGNKKRGDHGTFSLKEAEEKTKIKHQQVSQWKKKRKDVEKWAADISAAARRKAVEDKADTTATKWTGDPESYTPEKYIEAARIVMGGIDLDPASDALAQQVVKAAVWYGTKEDGLSRLWEGRVFLNPPYAFPKVQEFIDKLLESLAAGTVSQAILLTNNNTDTKWWQRSARLSTGVCFTAGRINFYKPDGSVSQPTNGQTFFYFGGQLAEFVTRFSEFGLVMEVVVGDSLS